MKADQITCPHGCTDITQNDVIGARPESAFRYLALQFPSTSIDSRLSSYISFTSENDWLVDTSLTTVDGVFSFDVSGRMCGMMGD